MVWWLKSYFFYLFKKGVERTIQEEQLKMNFVKSFIIMLALLTSTAHSGPLTYGICIAGCNAAWVACVAAGGGAAGVASGGVAVPVPIMVCNAAHAACVAACTGSGFLPTL